jgi:hypothetical protein
MAVEELPRVAFEAEDAGDAKRDQRELVASRDLRLEAFYLEGEAEVATHVRREVLELDRPPVAVVGCGSPSGLLDLVPTAGGWP